MQAKLRKFIMTSSAKNQTELSSVMDAHDQNMYLFFPRSYDI